MKVTDINALVVAIAILMFISCNAQNTQRMSIDDLYKPTFNEESFSLEYIEVFLDCEIEEQRSSLAQIKWTDQTLSLQNQRIDISPFKNGFQNNLFSSVLPYKEFEAFGAFDKEETSQNLNKAMEKVQLQKFEFLDKGNSSVNISGLVPGMNYYVRICHFDKDRDMWIPSQKVRFRAPICPSDEVRK